MANVIENNDLIEVKFGSYSRGQSGINVRHWKAQNKVGNSLDIGLFAKALDDIAAPLYKALMTNVASFYGVRVQRIEPGLTGAAKVSATNIGPGIAGFSGLPTQVCGQITLVTDLAGKANRGRVYVPFPDESDSVDATGLPGSPYVVRLSALGEMFDDVITLTVAGDSIELIPVLYKRELNQTQPIVDVTPRQRWSTQRKRGSYGAANTYPPF